MRYFLGYTTTYNNPDVLPAKKNGDTPKFVAILLGKLIFQMIKKRLRGSANFETTLTCQHENKML